MPNWKGRDHREEDGRLDFVQQDPSLEALHEEPAPLTGWRQTARELQEAKQREEEEQRRYALMQQAPSEPALGETSCEALTAKTEQLRQLSETATLESAAADEPFETQGKRRRFPLLLKICLSFVLVLVLTLSTLWTLQYRRVGQRQMLFGEAMQRGDYKEAMLSWNAALQASSEPLWFNPFAGRYTETLKTMSTELSKRWDLTLEHLGAPQLSRKLPLPFEDLGRYWKGQSLTTPTLSESDQRFLDETQSQTKPLVQNLQTELLELPLLIPERLDYVLEAFEHLKTVATYANSAERILQNKTLYSDFLKQYQTLPPTPQLDRVEPARVMAVLQESEKRLEKLATLQKMNLPAEFSVLSNLLTNLHQQLQTDLEQQLAKALSDTTISSDKQLVQQVLLTLKKIHPEAALLKQYPDYDLSGEKAHESSALTSHDEKAADGLASGTAAGKHHYEATSLSLYKGIATPIIVPGLLYDAKANKADSQRSKLMNEYFDPESFLALLEGFYNKGYVLIDPQITVNSKGSFAPYRFPKNKQALLLILDFTDMGHTMMDTGSLATSLEVDSGLIKGRIPSQKSADLPQGEQLKASASAVAILEDFVRQHPDFSYEGGRGLALFTPYYGFLGHRYQTEQVEHYKSRHPKSELTLTEATMAQEASKAQATLEALQKLGWRLMGTTYKPMTELTIYKAQVKADLANWETALKPLGIEALKDYLYPSGKTIPRESQRQKILQDAGYTRFYDIGSKTGQKTIGTHRFLQAIRLNPSAVLNGYAQIFYDHGLVASKIRAAR